MHSEPRTSGRSAARIAALALAAPVAAVAFAAPAAAAEIPGLDDVWYGHSVGGPAAGGTESAMVEIELRPAAGHEGESHEVGYELRFDDAAVPFTITPGDGCAVDGTVLTCTDPSVEGYTYFDFDVSAPADAVVGEVYPYTFTITVDGIVAHADADQEMPVHAPDSTEPDPHHPFLHGDPAPVTGAAPGSTVTVAPVFRQERDLSGDAAAVVAEFSDSFSRMGLRQRGAAAVADYDNCRPVEHDQVRGGVECVITGFTGATGSVLSFTRPIGYAVDADALGPFEVCGCVYSVRTIDEATLAADFGDLTWDPQSENLLGITTGGAWTEPADPELAAWEGVISVATSANPFDLQIPSGDIEGAVGKTDTVTVPVTNNGPATIYNREDDYGSASIRVQLPDGTSLDSIDSDGGGDWSCLDPESLPAEYERSETVLDRFDLYCFLMTPLAAGETVDFTFTVDLTGDGYDLGYAEVVGHTTGVGGASLEADFMDNVGALQNMAQVVEFPRNDFDEDGVEDLIAVRKSDGALVLYRGTESETLGSGTVVSAGWGHLDVVMAGDVTSDGHSDLLARDTRTGVLYTYPGDGAGGFTARVQSGSGWGPIEVFTAADTDGNGTVDIVATRRHDGRLFEYSGSGNGRFALVGTWGDGNQWIDAMTNLGDVDADGIDDLVYRMAPDQEYWVFLSTRDAPVEYERWFGSLDSDRRYGQIVGIGDMGGNGSIELALTDARTGALYRASITALGTVYDYVTLADSGWGGMRLPEVDAHREYDFDQNGTTDLLARNASTGTTYLYPGALGGGFGPRISWGSEFSGMNLVEAAGDLTGDNLPDVLARTSAGVLYTYPGDGFGGHGERVKTGTGWNAMSAIVSGHDFNGDGRVDIVAREAATGVLWLYPGDADGTVGSRVKIGTGWNAMKEITSPGDLDHDGIADVIAVRNSDNCMYFYGGKATGGVKNGVQVGCGWGGMNAVTAAGDFDGDGHADLVARRKSDGRLFLYRGDGKGDFTSAVQIGSGWNAFNLIA
ncbi:FG-GAP repeat domain-containing protein [Glycomyces terrestris]|uniref:VCBS repeat-containing protein n=1 Tax=Glycomyces terrestris TaxID=2493553 RepID=A0A426UXP7_9ACTN|nr:VCBS repeat-containing protein [Glycomyces terrestris]RRR99290.1 VCBS repeat-containing protein [Glycomyces terrestris]